MPTEEEIEKMTPKELAVYQKANCLFCKIVAKEIEAKVVYEDEHCLGILDINPATQGHVLLLPKEHYMLLPHVPEQVMKQLFLAARHISFAMLRAFSVQGTTLFVANGAAAGQRSPHFLMHIIPREQDDGLFPVPTLELPPQQRQQLSSALSAVFGAAYGRPPVQQKQARQTNLDDVSKLFLGGL
jgi:histidine triad (HIT) family protein